MPIEDTERLYRIQSKTSGRGGVYEYHSLTVPTWAVDSIPEHAVFEFELVDEGILYRYMGEET